MDANGALAKDANVEPIKLGSVLPKANFAFSNEFTYKGVSAGFLLSCRLGGIVYSATQAALDQYGVSEASAKARDAGGVVINGRTMINAQQWYETIGSSSGLRNTILTARLIFACKKHISDILFPAVG